MRVLNASIALGLALVALQAIAQDPPFSISARNGNDCVLPVAPDQVVGQMDVEQPATFPGGIDSSSIFMATRLKGLDASGCPDHAWVFTQFVVGKDGVISDVTMMNSACPKTDEAVVAVIRRMPRWKPGTCKGTPLNMRVNFPVQVRR